MNTKVIEKENVNVSEETKTYSFPLRQTVVKAQSNEALFKLIKQAIERQPVRLIVTPRVDVAGYPYFWVGVRHQMQELDFKLLVTEQIDNYIFAYLKGDEALPSVTDFNPTEKVENIEAWLLEHRAVRSVAAISNRDEINMKDGVNYRTARMTYKNGSIVYPSTKCEDVLSLILL